MFRIAILAFLALFLSACFEINEYLLIRKNGSGLYSFTISFANGSEDIEAVRQSYLHIIESRNKSKNPFAKDSIPVFPFNDLDTILHSSAGRLRSLEGIFEVEEIMDPETMSFGLKFEFANLQALNTALSPSGYAGTYLLGKKNFERTKENWLSILYQYQMVDSQKFTKQIEFLSRFYSQILYICTIVAENKVIKYTGPEFTLEDDGKTLKSKTDLEKFLSPSCDNSLIMKFK